MSTCTPISVPAERRAANPDDKLLPPISEMADTTRRLATEPDRRSGDYVLWTDTAASLQRLLLGLGISTLIGLGFGDGARVGECARGCRADERQTAAEQLDDRRLARPDACGTSRRRLDFRSKRCVRVDREQLGQPFGGGPDL